MEQNETVTYDVNFLKIISGIFRDTYLYIDANDDCVLAKELYKNGIRVTYKGEFKFKDSKFSLVMIKCKKKFDTILEEKIFPKIDHILLNKYGKEYDDFIIEFITTLDKASKGEVKFDFIEEEE